MDAAYYRQLQEYEEKIFGSAGSGNPTLPAFPPVVAAPSFSFGFPRVNDSVPIPAFNNVGTTSIFSRPALDIPPLEFTFGASQARNDISGSTFGASPPNSNTSDISMDSSWISCFWKPHLRINCGAKYPAWLRWVLLISGCKLGVTAHTTVYKIWQGDKDGCLSFL